MAAPLKDITIFTDGACLGNPGPGGYAAILRYGEHEKELTGGYRRTTNNRMELMAAVAALESLKQSCRVLLVTDSQYLAKGIGEKWALGWRAKGWRRREGPVPNWDLWARLLDACEQHTVRFEWVRGHAGHVENERCDKLATAIAAGNPSDADIPYENPMPPPQPGRASELRML